MKMIKQVVSALLGIALLGTASVGDFGTSARTNPQPAQQTAIKKLINDRLKQTDSKQYAEGEAVVMLDSSVPLKSGDSLGDKAVTDGKDITVDRVESFKSRKNSFSVASVSSDTLSTTELVKTLNKSEDILLAEPNYKYHTLSLTNDTYSQYQWYLDNDEGEDINPEAMWTDKKPTDKDTPVIVMMDTGVDCTHEDLKNKLWTNPFQDKLPGVHGINVLATDRDKMEVFDDNGHGTHCAGIIAAEQNNNTGISGISQNARIMAVKWLDETGSGFTSDAIAGYQYVYHAMQLGVNVVAINDSWGGSENSEILKQIIDKVGELGAVSVVAAGNEQYDLNCVYDFNTIAAGYDEEGYTGYSGDDYYDKNSSPHIFVAAPDLTENNEYYVYPACTKSDYIITVGASDENGTKADYSNYGDDVVDIFAPGSDILSSVSYNCFNPTIYEDTSTKCAFYSPNTPKQYSFGQFGEKLDISVQNVEKSGIPDLSGDTSSMKISFNNVPKNSLCYMEIPYTLDSPEQNPYISFMYKIDKVPLNVDEDGFFMEISGMAFADVSADTDIAEALSAYQIGIGYIFEKNDDWIHFTEQSSCSKTGKRKLVIAFSFASSGDYEVSFDAIAVSKGTDEEQKSFGKYDFYSGTSMAAPTVTGALALLREQDNTLDAKQTIDAVLGKTRQDSRYDYLCDRSSKLDLSQNNSVKNIPKVYSALYLNNKAVLKGDTLRDCKVDVNGKNVRITSASDSKIIITDPGALNREAEIRVYNKSGYDVLRRTFNEGEKLDLVAYSEKYFDNYNMTANGNAVIIGRDTSISMMEYDSGETMFHNSMEYFLDYGEAFGLGTDTFKHRQGSLAYYDGKIYADMTIYGEFDYMDFQFGYQSAVAVIDSNNMDTVYIKPADKKIIYPTLCVMGGSLYSIGGFDIDTSKPVKKVYKLKADNTWQTCADMPQPRAMGKAVAVSSNKLIYAMGTDGSDAVPQVMSFDGTSWTVSKADRLKTNKKFSIIVNSTNIDYYICGVSPIKNKLLFSDVQFEGLGDFLTYDYSKDMFANLGRFYHRSKYDFIRGIVVNDTYYGIAVCDTNKNEITDEEACNEEYYKSKEEYYPSIGNYLYSMKVDSAYCQVTSPVTDCGTVFGTGAYMPGETARISVAPNYPYEVVSITVNGKTVKGEFAEFKVTKDTTVTVKYKEPVTSVNLSAKSKTLRLGKKFTLKATVKRKTATNKKLSWSYSKKGILKATKKTNNQLTVKAKKQGTTYVIIKTKDGSKLSAKCKIKVTK